MIETKYLDITNITGQDDLYKELIKAIDPILEEEQKGRKELEKEFLEFQKPFVDKFNKDTQVWQEQAHAKLNPHKEQLNKMLEQIRDDANKKMQEQMDIYEKAKTEVEAWFKNETAEYEKQYNEQVNNRKKQFEEDLQKLADIANAAIKPINEEYERVAKSIEESQKKTVEDGTSNIIYLTPKDAP